MKRILLIGLLTSVYFGAVAQTNAACYNEWYATFKKYGATAVPDGTNEVVVTIRKDNSCQTLYGKIMIKDGLIVRGTLVLLMDDGTYEKPERTLSAKYETNPEATLNNKVFDGMSPSFMTSQDEQVNIFFYKCLNKTPKKYKEVTSPAQMGFN